LKNEAEERGSMINYGYKSLFNVLLLNDLIR